MMYDGEFPTREDAEAFAETVIGKHLACTLQPYGTDHIIIGRAEIREIRPTGGRWFNGKHHRDFRYWIVDVSGTVLSGSETSRIGGHHLSRDTTGRIGGTYALKSREVSNGEAIRVAG